MAELPALLRDGLALHAAGALAEAAGRYQAFLAEHPAEPNALHLLATLRAAEGAAAEAERLFRAALAAMPGREDTQLELARLLHATGRAAAALALLNRALAARPDASAALLLRAEVLDGLGRAGEAAESRARALGLAPPAPPPAQRVAEPPPDSAAGLRARSAALYNLHQRAAARAAVEASLALEPDNPEGLSMRAVLLHESEQVAAALDIYDRVLAAHPHYAPALLNSGAALMEAGRHGEALARFETAAAAHPGAIEPPWYASHARLQRGDLAAGWRDYEARRQLPQSTLIGTHPQPAWQGEPLAGRHILAVGEQGLGDSLQFCRYVPLLAAAGATVSLVAQPPLHRLLRSLPGLARVVGAEGLAEAELMVPLMSLPFLLGTTQATIPAAVPYLAANPAAVAAWRKRLAGVPGLTFISLQKGPPAEQAASPPPGMVLHDWTDGLADFADTAALVQALDLVITVDTAVAHLAGALACPVWLLNRHDRCWRWLWDRDDTPWYPTMRLFNQPAPGDWAAVLAAVVAALQEDRDGR